MSLNALYDKLEQQNKLAGHTNTISALRKTLREFDENNKNPLEDTEAFIAMVKGNYGTIKG